MFVVVRVEISKIYGACVFVRVSCEHGGSVRVSTSKFRFTPVKELPVPRLELMACLLLNKMMVSVKLAVEKEVSVRKIFCWPDSQIALWWIQQRHKKCNIRSRTEKRQYGKMLL